MCICVRYLCRAEITQLELVGGGVHQKVLWLYVAVAHPHAVDVRERSTHLCTPPVDTQPDSGTCANASLGVLHALHTSASHRQPCCSAGPHLRNILRG